MSESGKVITTHVMTLPQYFSVSNENIFLVDWETGVYQSKDDGVSWSFVFKSTDGWHCEQVIKVTTEHSDDFWTKKVSNNSWHLRVYSVDRRRSDGNVTWRDFNVTKTDGEPASNENLNLKQINLLGSRLLYDDSRNIFLSEWYKQAVHVLSLNGQYLCQLPLQHHIKNRPHRLALDKDRQLLYVGQLGSEIGVLKLTYGDDGD